MKPQDILQRYWGYTDFKGSQADIIRAVRSGKDVLALLPTGGGKSVCYQVPALAEVGICIVVSPLIALIQDQVSALKTKGIKAISLTGGLPMEEVINRLDNCQFGNYKFLYLSPERLQQQMVCERISQMHVNLFAIDEAHCISQWGNDFRPAYLECAVLRDLKPDVPVIALTATATREVAREIIENLKLRDHLIFKDSFFRPNIVYKVIQAEDKLYYLKKHCSLKSGCGIVYVRTRRLAVEVSVWLNKNRLSATYFHGGMPRKEKEDKLKAWMASKVQFIVATSAFGMGVDKPDVRLVVHFQIPDSIESYFQEAGRAGRDGLDAQALLFTNAADEIQLKKQFLSSLPDVPFLKKLYRNLNNYFQIPYGTGENSSYNFHFNHFCETYKLNGILAYNGLLLLDQNAVIALSQNFKRKTLVQFCASKAQLWEYLEKHQDLAPAVQLILRTYGGIFDYETKINTLLLARKSGESEEVILLLLDRLGRDEIINYTAQHGDLEITFLLPREDDRTINHFAPQVIKYQGVRQQQVEKMLRYIHNNKQCRTRQLLNYFGEKQGQDCGRCDVCLDKRPVLPSELSAIGEAVLNQLRAGAKTSRELIASINGEEAIVLKTVQLLLESGKIKVGKTNKYSIH